jgi:hypothetical protein
MKINIITNNILLVIMIKFDELFYFLKQNNIYKPNINKPKYYFDLVETAQSNNKEYIKFTKYYNKKNDILNIDYELIYYYLFIILYADIELELYEHIINILINGKFTRNSKIVKIDALMCKCGKTPDIIDGWTEANILDLLKIMIELNMKDNLIILINAIKLSPIQSYREIIPFLLDRFDLLNPKPKRRDYWYNIIKSEYD